MRQHHKAGDRLFVDYAGQTIPVTDPDTGEIQAAQIFVAVLGASNYTYAEAAYSQDLPSWVSAHIRAFEFFGGIPAVIVPDNLKSAVIRSCHYEPDLNPTYQEMAAHYGTAVLPARARKPKDKAKVEAGVLIVERWILAALRNRTFLRLDQLNTAISELLQGLNERPFKKMDGCRLSLFKTLDLPFQEQAELPEVNQLHFEERLGLLVDREVTERAYRKLKTRLKNAKLKQSACMENIDYRHARGLDKSLVLKLASCQWIQSHQNVLIIGPTGTGKTYLSSALANQACRTGYSVLYLRFSRLFDQLVLAKGIARYAKLLHSLAKCNLLILDDWGLSPLNDEQRRDLLEIGEDRHGSRSTIIASQLPIEHWHKMIGDPTMADAILDRLVHNAYKINLKGESMRKKQAILTQENMSE